MNTPTAMQPSRQTMLDKAALAFKDGQYKEALSLTGKLLMQGKVSVPLLDLHAQAAVKLGELEAALASITKSIQMAGATLERALFYGDVLLRLKRWQAAASVFEKIITEHENSVPAWLGLGHCFYSTEDVNRAVAAYRRVLAIEPEHEDAAAKLAECFLFMGHANRAAAVLTRPCTAHPNSARLAYFHGEALRQCSCEEKALEVLEPVRDDEVWGEKVERCMIMACLSLEKFDQAIALTEKNLAKKPDDVGLLGFKARLLVTEGKTESALELYEQVMEAQPDNYSVWSGYVKLRDKPLSEKQLARLQAHRQLLENKQQKRHLGNLYFALYWHYSLCGDTEKEMEALRLANDTMAELSPFDSEKHAEAVQTLRECYDRAALKTLKSPNPDFQGVFILCPPRSGSTLLEQALARHPLCWSGGEKPFAAEAWRAVAGNFGITANENLEKHQQADAAFVTEFAKAYLTSAREAGWQDGQWMVHKGIDNYKFAGLLKSAFPNAAFIELHRNPEDVAFGCYRQNFNSQPFSFTYDGCAMELAIFQNTMRWWQAQMPESIRKVRYEDLVEDFEGQIRGILKWLDLDWDQACLDFSRKSRVSTASVTQVRKGVTKQGVGRSQKYGDLLKPLREALARHGVKSEV
ncbi:MAG: sulfotransferase [Pseudomonadales bacterium]|nr:sulfotransferase [Pseudomonadales bacterium]